MDPVSIASACNCVALICIRTSATIYDWIIRVKTVDEEAQAFANEIRALARVLSTIDINLRRPAIAAAIQQSSSTSELWSNVKTSLSDCSETLQTLEKALSRVIGESKGAFGKVARSIRLNMASAEIARLRRQINAYKDTLQLALHMCLLVDNQASHASLEARIDMVLRETRNRLLGSSFPATRTAPQDPASSSSSPQCAVDAPEEDWSISSEVQVLERLSNVLEAAKSVTLASSTLDSISNSSSKASIGDEARAAIENWIWNQDGPSMFTWSKIEGKLPAGSRYLGKYDNRKGYNLENLHYLCDEVDALCENEALREGAVSLLTSFFYRWEKAHIHERHAFDEMLLQSAATAIRQQSGLLKGIICTNPDEPSLIHFLSSINRVDFLSVLFRRGAALEDGVGRFGTPLHFAARFGQAEAVLFLLDQGANPDSLDAEGMTPLMAACEAGQEITTQILVNRTGVIMSRSWRHGNTALHYSILKNLVESSKLLVAAALNIDVENANGETPLLIACMQGSYPLVEFILEKGADVNTCRRDGHSPLSAACEAGDVSIIRLLLERGAAVDGQARHTGRTPTFFACQRGDLDMMRLLLSHGAVIDSSRYAADVELFGASLESGNEGMVRFVIESDASRFLLARSSDGRTSLHVACQIGLPASIIQWLADANIDKDITDSYRKTPLHYASQAGNTEAIDILIETGASLDLEDAAGSTYLDLALETGKMEAVNLLLARFRDHDYMPNARCRTLYLAANTGRRDIIDAILGADALIDTKDASGNTALHLAAAGGSALCIGLLLEAGAAVSIRDGTKNTALHVAARGTCVESVKLLLGAGARVNYINAAGVTPLHYAAETGVVSILKALIEAGAYIDARDESGWTPRDIAERNGANAIVLQSLEFPWFYYCIGALYSVFFLIIGCVAFAFSCAVSPLIIFFAWAFDLDETEQVPEPPAERLTAKGNPRTTCGALGRLWDLMGLNIPDKFLRGSYSTETPPGN